MRRTWLARQSGQAVVLVAIAVVVLAAILMLALDGGSGYLDQRQLQNAADAAALAGAEKLTALPVSYSAIHNQALNNLLRNLPGTSAGGTVCAVSCPSQTAIGVPGANGVGTLSLGSGYYAYLFLPNAYHYDVWLWHAHQTALAPLHGFQSTFEVVARAAAQNLNYPYAIVLLQSAYSNNYSDLQMSGTGTQLNLSGPGGTNAADHGGVFSNASIDPGTGDIYFAPCSASNTTLAGSSGDLWAVNEAAGDGGRVNGEAYCGQTAPASWKTPSSTLPDPGYPEPAAPNATYNGATVVNGANQILCPGHYSNQINVNNNGIGLLYPGVYHVDAGGVSIAGTLRTFQAQDFSSGQVYTNPCGAGTTLSAFNFDPGVIIEVTPANAAGNTNCAKHLFTTIGGGSYVSLQPSTNYFNISVYIEEMPNWQNTCTQAPWGTNVVKITGGGYYNIEGAIYGPADNMQISGGAGGSGVGQIVAWTLGLNGGGSINETYDPNSLPYLKGLTQ